MMECNLKEKRDIGVNYVTQSDGLMDSLLKSKDKHKKLENIYILLVIVLLFVLWDSSLPSYLCLSLCLSRSEPNLCFNYL